MGNKQTILIRGGQIIDPSQDLNFVGNLLIENGLIKELDFPDTGSSGADILDAHGLVISPGFIDLHCHLREPGFEYKETIASGTKAAAHGGFTTVCAMPNTNPVTDSRSIVEFVLDKAKNEGYTRVLPIGAITKNSEGLELSEMAELADAGCIGFSDDGRPLEDAHLMRQALIYASSLQLPIINHCEVPELALDGVMHEGWVSNRLGLIGIPNSTEDSMVARDISLAEETGGRIHIAHTSTTGTMDLIKGAKERGVNISCEVTPHHLTLNDSAVLGKGQTLGPLLHSSYDTNAKVAPPLRSSKDVKSLVDGLKDRVVDFIATDHAPHSSSEKECSFEDAVKGISVLETALGSLLTLVHEDLIDLPTLIDRLTIAPANFLGMDLGTLKPGSPADITIFDPKKEWVVDSSKFVSKGKNTPLEGSILKGKVMATIFAGRFVYKSEGISNGN